MLAKKFRLPIQEFFSKKGARTAKNGVFLVKIFPNSLRFSRFGIVIGKKVAKKSTARNKIKRIIFSFLENFTKKENNNDFLIIVGQGAGSLTKGEISLQLEETFKKLCYD